MTAPFNSRNPQTMHPTTLLSRLPFIELDPATRTYNCYQSFNFVKGYEHLSFEELHLRATSPKQLKASERFGAVSDSERQILKDLRFKEFTQHLRNEVPNVLRLAPEIVTIRVGTQPDTKDFSIHENILLHCSPYFRTALKSEWRPESGIVSLEDDPAAFEIYNEWLYSGIICTFRPIPQPEDEDEDDEFELLAKAWIMGDKLLDTRFKNSIIDAFVDKFLQEGRLYLGLPSLIYTKTYPGSLLRKLLLDLYWWYGSWSWLSSKVAVEAWNDDFHEELMNRVPEVEGKGKERAPSSKLCRYHEHPAGEWCSHGNKCHLPPRAIGALDL